MVMAEDGWLRPIDWTGESRLRCMYSVRWILAVSARFEWDKCVFATRTSSPHLLFHLHVNCLTWSGWRHTISRLVHILKFYRISSLFSWSYFEKIHLGNNINISAKKIVLNICVNIRRTRCTQDHVPRMAAMYTLGKNAAVGNNWLVNVWLNNSTCVLRNFVLKRLGIHLVPINPELDWMKLTDFTYSWK